MCGISGIWNKAGSKSKEQILAACSKMASLIKHRGPDDMDIWYEEESNLCLSHCRLSIIDLTKAGRQPMISHDERYAIVYNGEIYNHNDIRNELNSIGSYKWRGTSDTETMLEAIATWGLDKAIERFNGMFAFALWDRKEKVLTLARDRLGEKPLYYGWLGNCFAFASELKSLRVAGVELDCPASVFDLDTEAISLFIRYQYIPTPWSIYKGINKLSPAHILKVNNNENRLDKTIPYWDLFEVAKYGIENPFRGSLIEGIDELEKRLKASVGSRMEADVPLGAFLSGGIDSSLVVSMMQSQTGFPVKTFTITFKESRYDESRPAREVANHLGTDHTEFTITPREAIDIIPKLAFIYDEPFADASQIATCLLSQLTKQHVTVALSGDGGDELFGGYYRHFMAPALWCSLSRMPQTFRQTLATALTRVPESFWNGLFTYGKKIAGPSWQTLKSEARIQKLLTVLSAPTAEIMYKNFLSYWNNPGDLLNLCTNVDNPLAYLPFESLKNNGRLNQIDDITCRFMIADARSYLPDDILVKLDRASMAASLEARAPLLDHELFKFAWQIPVSWKVGAGKGKRVIRNILRRYVPESCFERPKTGFAVPVEHWLRNELRDWAEAHLDEGRLKRQGIFNPRPIRRAWQGHISGSSSSHYHLWPILVFQSWIDNEKSYMAK